ncbi:MAG TPA: hypothetical protein P5262_02510 [Candidatus Moranbacteria bacterium]|nr:hypothetical protein [Candidatus Moranbacteria bacterium]
MQRIITLNSCSFRSAGFSEKPAARERMNPSRVLSMGDKKIPKNESKSKGSAKIVFLALFSVLVAAIFFGGALYLYQVNDLATKGYEIKDIEKRIQDLEREGKKMKIKEVELKSMYNIEKSTEELDLVSPQNITYVEMDSSVAMK